jgi:hypothetical protein
MSEKISMTANQQLSNKYKIGDKVWVVFNLEEKIKVNEFSIRVFNTEKVGEGPIKYFYGFSIDGEGKENGVNMSFFDESQLSDTKEEAIKKANESIEILKNNIDNEIEKIKQSSENQIKIYEEQKEKIHADIESETVKKAEEIANNV